MSKKSYATSGAIYKKYDGNHEAKDTEKNWRVLKKIQTIIMQGIREKIICRLNEWGWRSNKSTNNYWRRPQSQQIRKSWGKGTRKKHL